MAIALRFAVTEEFFSPELQSHYCPGLTYAARPQDEVLLGLVTGRWLTEGKVVLLNATHGAPQITGA